MKIAFITTVDHNVGDDFIREGIKYLLKKFYGERNIKFSNIHKHSPITARYGFEKVRSLRQSERWDTKIPLWITKDKILEADLVVQSGAPVYWYHKGITDCVKGNEWYNPLVKKRFSKNKNGILINLAAGSCQKYYSTGEEFFESEEVCDYIKEFHSRCKVTTVRDKLAKKVLLSLGLKSTLIACSSIFASDEYNITSEGEEYVVVNYMSGGGHFIFGQEIDSSKWEKCFKEFYFKIKKEENVVFSCHNKKEIREAKFIDPDANIFYSNNYLDYIKFYSKAKYGFMNRIHAAYQMSSYGKQSLIVGADTRALMAEEINIGSYFVNTIDTDILMHQYKSFKLNHESYKFRFKKLKKEAFDRYMDVLNLI